MNPPIHSMPPASYQQSATPMYPLKPEEVPTIPNSYPDGRGSLTGYPPAPGYPPSAPDQPPGQYIHCRHLLHHTLKRLNEYKNAV